MTISMPDVFVLLAAGSYFVGYLIINQVALRLFVLVGTFCYIGYYATVAETPLWVAIWTTIALAVANVFGLSLLLAYRSRLSIPAEYRPLYDSQNGFQELPPGDFGVLMKSARRRTYPEGYVLTREGEWNKKLYFILDGTGKAEKLGHVFDLPKGIFVGEVAFMLNQPASATVTVEAGSTLLEWELEELTRKSRRTPRFKLALEALISRDLARKVALAVAPDVTR